MTQNRSVDRDSDADARVLGTRGENTPRLSPGFGRPRDELRSHHRLSVSGRVSVVIPCFNAQRWVGDSISSVLEQRWPDIEVVVVDDGSTDSSWEVVLGFGDRISAHRIEHSGAAAARNRGLMSASGEFIQFLDADDRLLPGAIERRAEVLGGTAEVDAVFGDRQLVDGAHDRLLDRTSHERWPEPEPLAHVIRHTIHTECPLHRAALVYAVGGFDESLPCSQERDLHIRLLLAGARFVYIPMAVSYARVHCGTERIENQPWWTDRPALHLELVDHHLRLINDAKAGSLTPSVLEALAYKLWSRGAIAARNGQLSVARRYFSRARALSPRYRPDGSFLFRALHRLLGPTCTGWLLYQKHRIKVPQGRA